MSSTNKKILIVDDEPTIIEAIEFLMLQQGYEVEKAYEGNTALQKMAAQLPHVVILDVMMPGLNGFEVAQKIRANTNYDTVSIIFLTAKGTGKDKMQGYDRGGEVYLTKPFDNDELVHIVNELVSFT